MKAVLTLIGLMSISLTVFGTAALPASCNDKFPGDTGYWSECAAGQDGETLKLEFFAGPNKSKTLLVLKSNRNQITPDFGPFIKMLKVTIDQKTGQRVLSAKTTQEKVLQSWDITGQNDSLDELSMVDAVIYSIKSFPIPKSLTHNVYELSILKSQLKVELLQKAETAASGKCAPIPLSIYPQGFSFATNAKVVQSGRVGSIEVVLPDHSTTADNASLNGLVLSEGGFVGGTGNSSDSKIRLNLSPAGLPFKMARVMGQGLTKNDQSAGVVGNIFLSYPDQVRLKQAVKASGIQSESSYEGVAGCVTGVTLKLNYSSIDSKSDSVDFLYDQALLQGVVEIYLKGVAKPVEFVF